MTIQSIYNLITTSNGKLTAIYPALLAVINNVAYYLEDLSSVTCTKLMQLFNSMSSPSFLLSNDTNHNLLRSLLESMNSILEHQLKSELFLPRDHDGMTVTEHVSGNPKLVAAILRNRKRFEALRNFTLESGREEIERRNQRKKDAGASSDIESTRSSVDSLRSPAASHSRPTALSNVPEEDGTFTIGDEDDDSDEERQTPSHSDPSENPSRASSVSNVEDAVPTQLRGMSEKARGKMPAGMQNFSRQNSITSLSGYSMSGPSQSGQFEPTAQWIDSWLPELPLHTMLTTIQQVSAMVPREALVSDSASPETLRKISQIKLVGVDVSPIRVHSFEWSPLALGWYESLIWSFIFSSEMQVSRGTVGIWNGTAIKLFRVQETAPEGPTLTSPRGAVDAVGSNIVSRIGSINLRGPQAQSPTSGAGPGGSVPLGGRN